MRISKLILTFILFAYTKSFFAQQAESSTISQTNIKSGSMNNCKLILSEACRNFILKANVSEILPQFQDAYVFKGKEIIANAFTAKIVESTGSIYSIDFNGDHKVPYGKPADNLKWGESLSSVKKKYGEPLKTRVDLNTEFYAYQDFTLEFFAKKLQRVNLSRPLTEAEKEGRNILSHSKEAAVDANIAAKQAQISRKMQDAEEKKSTKEMLQPAKEMFQMQKDLVQYLSDAVNGNELSEMAKSKFRTKLDFERTFLLQLEKLVKITEEASNTEL